MVILIIFKLLLLVLHILYCFSFGLKDTMINSVFCFLNFYKRRSTVRSMRIDFERLRTLYVKGSVVCVGAECVEFCV